MLAIPGISLFDPGQFVITPGAEAALAEASEDANPYLRRHLSGDWGDLCVEDQQESAYSLDHNLRLFSAYILGNGRKTWIITEADRSATTVLLPDEY